MAISAALAPAVTQASLIGIFTLFNLSQERIPKQSDSPTATSGTAVSSSSPPQTSPFASPPPADSSLSSSPRHYPTDLSHPILEEGDESESDAPNEPVTPVSGRQSQDFHAVQSHDIHHSDSNSTAISSDGATTPFSSIRPEAASHGKPPIILNTAPTPSPKTHTPAPATPPPPTPKNTLTRTTTNPAAGHDPQTTPLSRRSSRGLTIRRTMSSFFRRSNSQSDKVAFGLTEIVPTSTGTGNTPTNAASDSNLADVTLSRKLPGRPLHKSSTTTQSNTPPSPGTPPLEIVLPIKGTTATIPSHEDFLNNKKKTRASTGLSFHRAINFVTSSNGRNGEPASNSRKVRPQRRRASSFDQTKEHQPIMNRGEPWALPAEAGTGLKARRMSLSLPDDFTVDIAELHDEFDYLHKMGRHRKHLGKGATSKVTLMFRKGYADELYAVKEFRGKSSSETKEEYEKKVKSEYSIAKSLHHPNIVETIRLCTDHGRWNHVMEYCQEGDLFSLVDKKYLTRNDREKDRQCLFKQLIQGLNYLHSNGIAHRDIKLENLLITNNSKLKITDFGVSEVFSGIHPGLREAGGQCGKGLNPDEVRLCAPGICGSLPYISPEVLAGKEQYDPRKLDVWGAAIVMLNLIFGAPLWREAKAKSDAVQYIALTKGWDKWNAKHPDGDDITDVDYPKVLAFDLMINPPVLRRILLQMLNPDPEKRVTIDKVANVRWMKSIECCQMDSYDDPAKFIDASKKDCTKLSNGQKIYCHDHLPPRSHGHSLGKMPGTVGY